MSLRLKCSWTALSVDYTEWHHGDIFDCFQFRDALCVFGQGCHHPPPYRLGVIAARGKHISTNHLTAQV